MASMDTWTMVQLRAECAKLGITPGRSKPETVTRIMEARARPGNLGAMINAAAREVAMSAEDAAALVMECATTPDEEAAMADYSAEMRRMDEMGETAWLAEQFPPHRRMSRLARALCGSTALRGAFAVGHPCVYMGAPLTVDIASLVGFEAGVVARSWAPEPCARKWA